MNSLFKSRMFFWSVQLLVLAALVFLSSKIDFVFQPIGVFIGTLFAPLLIAGFLYYVLNPALIFLNKRLKVPRLLGIIIVFILLIFVMVFSLMNLLPSLIEQITELAKNVPQYFNDVEQWVIELQRYQIFKNIDFEELLSKADISYGSIVKTALNQTALSFNSIFGVITKAVFIIGTVPFLLFYMLKDGDKFLPFIKSKFLKEDKYDVIGLLKEMNQTISTYISGQAIECLFVGVGLLVGYLLLGLPYAFLFAVVGGLTNLIPYLGPYLGALPVVLVTIFDDPVKTVIAIGIVLIVQQIDGNIIYPNVIGKTLAIHPMTIIIILLVAGKLAGLLGIFLGVPIYSLAKVLIRFCHTLYLEHKQSKLLKTED
ncbi:MULTISPECIES: AI-2E family transporter [unclassified Enterococcus]|uniref:AI-2E family transporter n=1 Tax=unclassified Enterococcus TaxID=2608891 RepID=UPI0015577F81|nr:MULTISPECIES: AI-2E family transporter [unclassified Enterococcus]MBS7577754.1 AI-2E family transporter [Enterococcus sp. MMGLQ5-2]MBS7584052.1 AI-2E family transporter [Enterococcus sp. MMGLQ5-1]NPD11913.1 AI-2E family transporter [Enterococcus sp. MMGLQ5-1]NPD37584.1 AI-2E family transporter [Enterococcus sp. MMGLQ5-2]